jgi:hypothetical protein
MNLVFSWFSDAGAWPEHPGSGCAVVDEAGVGPSALLDCQSASKIARRITPRADRC